MKLGQSVGLTDQLLRDIHVGDLLQDCEGRKYTVDRYGRAKPTSGGNEVPIRNLRGCEVISKYAPDPDPEAETASRVEMDEEEKAIQAIHEGVDAAGDQMLVDKLRERGWTVSCTRVVEKLVYEEVAL